MPPENLDITQEDFQLLSQIKARGLSLVDFTKQLTLGRDIKAQRDTDEGSLEGEEVNEALKRQMGRMVKRFMGAAELAKFNKEVNYVDIAIESQDQALASGSAYSDASFTKQVDDELYKAYTGLGIILHNGSFAPVLSGVQLQLLSGADIRLTNGKLSDTKRMAKYLLGGNPHVSDADFDTNPSLNGGPLPDLWQRIHSMGMAFHEAMPVAVLKQTQKFTTEFKKNSLTAPAQSVTAVSGVFIYGCYRAWASRPAD